MRRQLTLKFPHMAESIEDFDGDPVACIDDVLNNEESILGLTPCGAEVQEAKVVGEDIVATVLIDPKSWIRQAIELDEDLLEIFAELKSQMSREEIAALVTWMRNEPDLKVTMITVSDGEISVDRWPTTPKL